MSNFLHNVSLQDLLAPSIGTDKTVKAVAAALDPVLHSLARQAPQLLLWARLLTTAGLQPAKHHAALERITQAAGGLQKLDTATLEQLAWQLHVDFREAAQNNKQLAGLVVNSIPWHRIKGTPASLKAALELFGYTGVTIEEDGTGANWATYQLDLGATVDTATLRHIVEICREMQPARCKLWRVYNDLYDWRPGVWSGPMPQCGWSNFWWSLYSGVPEPSIPGFDDDHDLIVSFGALDRVQAEIYAPDPLCAGMAMASTFAWMARYIDDFVWGYANWGDTFQKNHGFVFGTIISLHACELLFESSVWPDTPWPVTPWAKNRRWDRQLPKWKMFDCGQYLSELAWSDRAPDGTWGDINANWGTPVVQVMDEPPAWSDFAWSESEPQIHTVEIKEQTQAGHSAQSDRYTPAAVPMAASVRTSMAHQARRRGSFVYARDPWGIGDEDAVAGPVQHTGRTVLAGTPLYESSPWPSESWRDVPWGQFVGYGQQRADCRFRLTTA